MSTGIPVERLPILDGPEQTDSDEHKDVVPPLVQLPVIRRDSSASIPSMRRGLSSFISQSTSGYGGFNRSVSAERDILHDAQTRAERAKSLVEKEYIVADAESKTAIKCLLSLATPADTDRALDWINIQITNDIRKPYLLDEFIKYCNACGVNIPDPTRALPKLNHMVTRAFYTVSLPDYVRAITSRELTDEFVDAKLKTLTCKWREGVPSSDIPEFKMGIFMNISSWDRLGFIHDLNVEQSRSILMTKPVGSWLLRKSSRSTQSTFRTVFTISTRVSQIEVYHVRFVLMHGIGLYSLTCAFFGADRTYMTDAELDEQQFANMISTLRHSTPIFVCITEMLQHLDSLGLIKLSEYVTG